MHRQRTLALLCALLCLIAVPALATPRNALAPWPEDAIFAVVVLENVKDMATELAPSVETMFPEGALVAEWLRSVPVKSVAVSFGYKDWVFRLQGALSFGPEKRTILDRIAGGTAEPGDLDALLDNPAEGAFDFVLHENATYLIISDGMVLAMVTAKEDTLLLGFAPEDLTAGLEALENAGKRLVIPRKYTTPDFLYFADNGMFVKSIQEEMGEFLPLRDVPFRMELGFTPQEKGWRLSAFLNLARVFFSDEALSAFTPLPPHPLPLFGEQAPFFAARGRLPITDVALAEVRAAAASGDEDARNVTDLLDILGHYGLNDSDLKDLLGSFSLVAGGEAKALSTLLEAKVPGVYLTLTGTPEAHAKALAAAERFAAGETAPPVQVVDVPGWTKVFVAEDPLPFVTAFRKDLLLLGFVDPKDLEKSPVPQPTLEALSEKALLKFLYLHIPGLRTTVLSLVDPVGQPWHEAFGLGDVKEFALSALQAFRQTEEAEELFLAVPNVEEVFLEGVNGTADPAVSKRMEALTSAWQAVSAEPSSRWHENSTELSPLEEESVEESTPTP